MEENVITHKEASVKIYFSLDYKMFKFMKGNRLLNRSKINKIVEAARSGEDIFKYAPVIVNKDMEIIDGQHRFAAALDLKLPIFYVIKEDATLALVPKINSRSSNWGKKDYLESYSDLKIPAYLSLKQFMREFPKMGLAVAVSLMHAGQAESKSAREDFPDGNLSQEHLEFAKMIAQLLQDFAEYVSNPFHRKLVQVMLEIHNNGKYDHQAMLKKMKDSGLTITRWDSSKTVLQELETIINFKARQRILLK